MKKINENSLLLYIIILTFFIFFFLKPVGITFAATPTPTIPSVSDSPDPQVGGSSVTFSCPSCTAAAGETLKLYVCSASDCSNCKITKINAPSNPTFTAYGSYSSYATQNNPGNTLNEDDVWGNISIYDAWNNQDVGGNWTWDFGSSITGTFRIEWFAKITGDYLPNYCVDVYYGVYISNDGSTWTAVRTGEFYHVAGAGAWSPYTSSYIEAVSGTYRYVRASIYSTTSCMVRYGELWVDVVSVDREITSNCWAVSPAVSSNPSASYTCPSCTYATNNYYGITCSQQERPATCSATSSALTFTCKKQETCSCSSDSECYNYCWPGENGKCYNSACIKTLEKSGANNPACVNGVVVNHDTTDSSARYVVFNGELYYCKQAGGSGSGYAFVQDVNPGSAVGSWKCGQDGIWRGGTIIGVRGGRIRIV